MFVCIEAGHTLQVVKIRQHSRQEPPGAVSLWKCPVLIARYTRFSEPSGQQVSFMLGGELQVVEHSAVGIVPPGEGTGLPLRRCLRRGLRREPEETSRFGKCLVRLPEGDSLQPGVQRDTVAAGIAEVTAVDIFPGVQGEVVFLSSPVIKCKKTPRKKCRFVADEKGKR